MQLRRNTRVRTATIDRATDYGGPADHSPPPFAFRRFRSAQLLGIALAKFAEHEAS